MDENALDTVNYRLTNIENTLTELKNVVLENKLQARDIKELADKNKEILNAINSHEQRIKKLELQPDKDKAAKWQVIADYIFKAVIVAVVAIVAAKLGLK